MAKRKREARKSERGSVKTHRYILKTGIAEDQRKYIEGIREWLHDSLKNKGKVVGGPV